MTTDTPTGHVHRCQHYDGRVRCKAQATHRFLVDGYPATYAGYTCLEHGEQVIAEYAVLSPQIGVWTLEEIPHANT
jgi:hypothetical protein